MIDYLIISLFCLCPSDEYSGLDCNTHFAFRFFSFLLSVLLSLSLTEHTWNGETASESPSNSTAHLWGSCDFGALCESFLLGGTLSVFTSHWLVDRLKPAFCSLSEKVEYRPFVFWFFIEESIWRHWYWRILISLGNKKTSDRACKTVRQHLSETQMKSHLKSK